MTFNSQISQLCPNDDISLQRKIEYSQLVIRKWPGHLTLAEFAVLAQIMDRTIGWGRRETYITTSAMLDGDDIYGRLNMSRSTLFRALADLEKKGFICRRRDRKVKDRVHYSVNTDWRPGKAEPVPECVRATSRSAVPQCHSDTTPCQPDTTQCHSDTLYNSITPSVSNISIIPGATAPVLSNPADRVREEERASAARNRSRLAAKTTIGQITERAEAAWRKALIDTFPEAGHVAWGVRQKAQIKHVAKNWAGKVPFIDMIEWAVTNWTAIMSKQFRWMKKSPPPPVPAFAFFIRFIDGFAECHSENKLDAWLSRKERTEIEQAMARGQTYEQAVAKLAKSAAMHELREEMDLRDIKARARERRAEERFKQADALATMQGRAPVHPQSIAAKRMLREAEEAARIARAAERAPVPPPDDKPADPDFTGAVVYFVDPDRNPFDHG